MARAEAGRDGTSWFLAVASLIALTTLLHYEVLSRVDAPLPGLRMPRRSRLLVAMSAVFLAHALHRSPSTASRCTACSVAVWAT